MTSADQKQDTALVPEVPNTVVGYPASVGGYLRTHGLPFLAFFFATAVLNSMAAVLVYSKGLTFLASFSAAAIQVPLVVLLAVAARAVLGTLKKFSLRESGLTFEGTDLLHLLVGSIAGTALIALPFLLLSATGIAPLERSAHAPTALLLLGGLLASVVNAAFQQLPLQVFAQCLSSSPRASRAGLLVSILFFTAIHLSEAVSPLLALGVFLFGLLNCQLFYLPSKPSYAAVAGLHGGWNFSLLLLLGMPFGPTANTIALYQWPRTGTLWTGGALGSDAGLASIGLLVLLNTALYLYRQQRPATA